MYKTSEVGKLNAFGTSVGECDIHLRLQRGKMLYYFCTLFIRKFSSIKEFTSSGFDSLQPGFKCSVNLSVKEEEVIITVVYLYKDSGNHQREVTILTDGGIVLFHERKENPASYADEVLRDIVSVRGDDLKKLKQLPNHTFVLNYRIKRGVDELILKHICSNPASNSKYLKSLHEDLKNCSTDYLNEKVILCVGTEAEVVNKAVLCARSPEFAKMFDSGMKENKSNTVILDDIEMPVVRALASFLRSGLLSDQDFDLLFDLYSVAYKYDIRELQQACVRLLLDKVTSENVLKVLKLSEKHNDEILKSAALTLISANIETVALSRDWKDLMRDNPVQTLKCSTFSDFRNEIIQQ